MKNNPLFHRLLSIAITLVFVVSVSNDLYSALKIPIRIVINFGKYNEKTGNCIAGNDLCSIGIEIINTSSTSKDNGTGSGEIKEGQLIVNLDTPLKGNISQLPVRKDIVLTEQQSKLFGYTKVTILKNEYSVDRTKNKMGVILFDVKTEGAIKPPIKSK